MHFEWCLLISGIDSRFATVPIEDRGDRLTYAVSSDEPGELGHGGLSLIPTNRWQRFDGQDRPPRLLGQLGAIGFLPVPPLGPAVILQSSVGGRRELIDLGGQDEVAFRQAIDLVSPDRESNHTPCQVDIWVVSLGFSQLSDSVGECEGLPEVFESKLFLQMMLFNGSPVATELPLESL